ncbi:MAG: polysaccharide biosynthesis protein [Rhodocyclaceae bacterium]|nr:MAG: polysaccharide biosynthesis protein [Rhodocyclaceae bacterium]
MNPRSLVASLHDLVAAALAWIVGYALRFNFDIPPDFAAAMVRNLYWIIPLQAVIFHLFGLYRGIWRFASIPDLRRIALAAGTVGLAIPALLLMLQRLTDVPRSVLVLHPILLVLMMGGSRFLYRAWRDGHLLSLRQFEAQPVIVMGAGSAAAALLRELSGSARWRVVGLVDDAPTKLHSHLHGVTVLGPLASLGEHARRLQVEHVIVAMPSVAVAVRRRAVEMAVASGLKVLTVPSMADVLSGKISVSSVRQVELEDLLGRDPVQLDSGGLHGLLNGKVVLVTGAGGSIGSELCRQIAVFAPARLLMVDHSEFALYRMEQEFSAVMPALPVSYLVGDVKDKIQLDRIFVEHRPQVVFHAAAYKHVPLMESGNAWQAVRNNVQGTRCVAEVAMAHGVEKFVLISTDKAVNPTNVMGTTKRLAELTCQALQRKTGGKTRFVMVRFGNVLGSSGSVIPKFREQIAQGGPVTVTHPDIVRYFMLIPEAAQLVLQAGLMGQGGEIFVLDMGEPVKIVDLARDMIRLSGFSEEEIPIAFSGLRPGEKLYEELLADSESTLATPHPKLRVAKADALPDDAWLERQAQWLALPHREYLEVKADLQHWVPEYRPTVH